MSNKFSAGTYTFVPTTEELLEFGTDYRNISAIGFRRNYNDIIKYFNIENADIKYKYKLIAIDGVPLKGKNK